LFELIMGDWDKEGAEGIDSAPVSTKGKEISEQGPPKRLRVSETDSVPVVSFTTWDLF
jgi:hypothetical protein